jgi:large subunit ribosomal protein L24
MRAPPAGPRAWSAQDVQTTLLGLAVAVIVALVAALVGPLMIDWGSWRATFETEATRVIGVPVRIAGDIDARLLPVPSLTLRRIEAGTPGSAVMLRARALEVELGLGSLVRGEWRANEVRIAGPDVAFGLDKSGALIGPPIAIGFDPDQLSIDRLAVEDARLTLVDAANGGRLVIEHASFRGEARSLLGPFKGEGQLSVAGQRYAYRLSGSRRGDDGGTKLRLNLDAVDRPLALETDGTLWPGEALPRYDGTIALSRPVGQVLSSGKAVTNVPWRVSGRVRGSSASALFEQIEMQYGPDDHAIKVGGSAQLRFGSQPRIDGVMTSRQMDADRWLTPDAGRRPAALLAALADQLTGVALPLPLTLGIGIDNLTFGGAVLQAVRGDLRIEGDSWNLDSLEFRAPGLTQVRMSGAIAIARGIEFKGPAVVESADPRTLVAWLEGRADAPRVSSGSLSVRGDLALGRERIAVERLHAEFDRRALDGRLAYTFAAGNRPARLEASISAADFDVDAALAFAGNALAGAAVDRPGEVALALDFAKASYAGVEARGAKAKLTFDPRGLAIDQLSIADVNGAKVEARGRIDNLSTTPHGTITLAIDAPRLDGAARLAGRLAPQASQAVQSLATRAAATRLNAKLDIGAAAAGSGATTAAKLAVDGAIGPVRVAIVAAGHGDAASPGSAAISLDGRLESDSGAALAALIGIDRYAGLDTRAARFTLRAGGKLDAALTIDTAFAGAGLDATAAGSLGWSNGGPKGTLAVAVAAADVKPLRRAGAAQVMIDVAARLAIDGAKVAVSDIKGSMAGSAITGRLGLSLAQPLGVDGRIDAERVELAPLLALALGMPADRPSGPEPFAVAPPVELAGRIAFTAKTVALTAALAANEVSGTLVLEPAAVAMEAVAGRLANGRLSGDARLHIGQNGVTLYGVVTLTDAALNRLLSSPARPSGRFTLQLRVDGSGRSPAALIGALRGGGTLTIDNLQAPGLDPNAIGAAIRAADQGVSVDVVRIGDIVRSALDRGNLTVPWIGGGFTIADGRASFDEVTAKAQDADLTASGGLDLADYGLNLRVGLVGAPGDEGMAGHRPRIDITVKGPIEAPSRNADVSSLVSWLTLRSVDRESKRVEAAEREAKRLQAIAREAKRREEAEAARRAQETSSVPVPSAGDASSIGRLPALPPPIDIRPVPTDRGGRRAAPAVPFIGAPTNLNPETR